MSNNRTVAGGILTQARKVVTTERGAQHGSAEDSFRAIGEMWVAYLNQKNVRECGMPLIGLNINARDVAFMMAQMKMVRVVWGDETQIDNYVDGAGYFSLAGMFGMPDASVERASAGVAGGVEHVLEANRSGVVDHGSDVIDPNKEEIPDFLRKKEG